MEFKTESQLRVEFDQMMNGTMNEHFQQIVDMQAQSKKDLEDHIADMRSEGFHKEANEAEQAMNIQDAEQEKKLSEMKEQNFQKYLKQYEDFKQTILDMEKLTQDTIAKVEKFTAESIARMESIVPEA
ncbi:MAG: hypothetical protein ACJAV6_000232 [Candidatus Paceibacteria bacterium]|jgi:hypothetical protein